MAHHPISPPSPKRTPPPAFQEFALQGLSLFTALSLAWPYYLIRGETLPWFETSLLIGSIAFGLSCITRKPWWWRVIHLFFAPLAYEVSHWQIRPEWFLAGFLLLFLIFRGALSGQIPLFLSNRVSLSTLVTLPEVKGATHFLDLGAGVASIVSPLARAFPNLQCTGVENAWLPWLIGKFRTRHQKNVSWHHQNLWETDLSRFDVVYAFLSPAPMSKLWLKARREMKPGSLFISNTFDIPGIPPARLVHVPDKRHTCLYCYRL